MAARKTTKKASGTTKTARKKAAAKAPPAKKVATKKAATKKAAAKKAAPDMPAEAKPKKAAGKKTAAKGISSTAVNMGHVFALKPRVKASFRQEDLLTARRLLDEESYGTIEEAARAVAERALELSNEPKGKRGQKRGR